MLYVTKEKLSITNPKKKEVGNKKKILRPKPVLYCIGGLVLIAILAGSLTYLIRYNKKDTVNENEINSTVTLPLVHYPPPSAQSSETSATELKEIHAEEITVTKQKTKIPHFVLPSTPTTPSPIIVEPTPGREKLPITHPSKTVSPTRENEGLPGTDAPETNSSKFGDIIDSSSKLVISDNNTMNLETSTPKTNSTKPGNDTSDMSKLIIPGTYWCGDGNMSQSYETLGMLAGLDSCCREHDFCPDYIEKGSIKHGLRNTGFFTWSHCDCEIKFRECLKEQKNVVANIIGYGYFNSLAPKCFKKDYPIVGCKEYKFITYPYKKRYGKKCVKYILEENRDKIWEFFEAPMY